MYIELLIIDVKIKCSPREFVSFALVFAFYFFYSIIILTVTSLSV